ncbi:MAG: SCO family protein [Candidatus Omnitrophica bacterium]|nr:SCO family protein [Candidatus Omnitrophota bacterium]
MTSTDATRRYFSLAGAVAIMLTGTALWMAYRVTPPPRSAPALHDYGVVPAFALVDSRRQPVTRERLSGSVWVADFIFTRCAGQCPIMHTQMATVSDAFRHAPDVRFISFTVDPAHDTPEVLAVYASRYRAQARRWQFVTGDPSAVLALAQQGFHLGVVPEGSEQEPITHSARLVLVDRASHIRGYYDATDPEAVRRLQADIRRLLQERS